MFDLEYYNQITDFGKLYEEFIVNSRNIRSMSRDNVCNQNKTKRKAKMLKETEYYINELGAFLSIHKNGYYEWYDDYYNRESLIKKTDKHFKNNEDEICVFNKPYCGSDILKF